MLIDGPITTEMIDSSGEILKLDGLDISDFLEGKAWANFEHDNDNPENILGHFIYAKKITSEKDCENDRQKEFWNQLKTPFLYGICELLDDEDHPGAVAVAAMLRYFKKRQEPVRIGFSIEGSTLKRKDNVLERTVGRRVAITLRPCNRQCWVDMLTPDQAGEMIKKTESSTIATVEVDSAILSDNFLTPEVDLKIALMQLQKTLAAAGGDVAPSMLTQGSALARESLVTHSRKNALRSAVRDWDRKRPLREVVKAALPDVSDDYLDHFVDLAEEISLRKGGKPVRLPRIGAERSENKLADDDQKRLIDGLYLHNNDIDRASGRQPILRLKNDAGEDVIVKMPNQETPGKLSDADRTTLYYQMAKNFFGMGAHVPVTNHFTATNKDAPWAKGEGHATHGKGRWSAMKYVDADPVMDAMEKYMAYLDRNRPSIHKLALMDAITATSDRHEGNALIDSHGNVYHIDNDFGFAYPSKGSSFHVEHVGKDALHPEAADWLKSLDPKVMAHHMLLMGADRETIQKAVMRLERARHLASGTAPSLENIINYVGTDDQGDGNI